MDIGTRLKTARISLGISQTEIANVLGIESSFLSNVERGAKKPPKNLIELFSSRYKINANWILTGEGDMAIEDKPTKAVPLIKEIEVIIHKTTSQKFSEIEERLSALESIQKEKKPTYKTTSSGDDSLYTSDPTPAYSFEYKEGAYEEIPYVHNIAAGPPTTID
ncbi:MAG: helix-turn-helix domain-containing protein, partial [Lentimicrobiaceae bacterium]|nr:helix-turn-helix domain-containing protein [Lentimicrobiaceae bacterium]